MRDEAVDIPDDQQEDDGAVRSGIPPPTRSAHERHDEPPSGLHGGLMSEHNDHGKPRERELPPPPPPPPPPRHGPNPGDVPIPGGPPHPHGSRGRHRRHRRPFPGPFHGPPGPGGPPPPPGPGGPPPPPGPGGPPPPPNHPRFPPASPPDYEFPGPSQHPGYFSTWPTWSPSPYCGPSHHPSQFAFTGCTCYEGPHQPAFNTSPFGQSCSCQLWDYPDPYSFGPPHPLSGHHRSHRRGGAFRGRGHRSPAQGHRWEWRAPPEPESESESTSDSTIEDREEDQAEMELPNEVSRVYETTDQTDRATGKEDDWEGVEDDERVSPTILAKSVEEGKAIEE
ncbi:hypothetical protein A7U60_g2046 [Sanghuangporus baumii]|uniref:Uncharacterized protein n=1 Tax=Sanghuangporus baumii TaxID=108892 RepID=A0A9Q5I2Z3_SANBA|nr:hypothetical protein A7U60_g2046 [Sanghuangporus baumii]